MNSGFTYRERIGPEAAGESVLAYLTRRYRHTAEADWRGRIASGEVVLEEAPAEPEMVLRRGQSLVWRRPPWQEPTVPLAFAVIHRDPWLMAVAKPRGLPTVPNGGFLEHTLLHLVRRLVPSCVPLHRLGRGTSGIVLFALTPAARRSVFAAWRQGRVDKTYRALVTGIPGRQSFSVDAPIGPVPHPRLGQVHAASTCGKPALSHVRVLARGRDRSVVEVHIPTGRPHQIRIHLAHIGHPVVGDKLYGGDDDLYMALVENRLTAEQRKQLIFPNHALHASSLRFHWRDREWFFQAEPEQWFSDFILNPDFALGLLR